MCGFSRNSGSFYLVQPSEADRTSIGIALPCFPLKVETLDWADYTYEYSEEYFELLCVSLPVRIKYIQGYYKWAMLVPIFS